MAKVTRTARPPEVPVPFDSPPHTVCGMHQSMLFQLSSAGGDHQDHHHQKVQVRERRLVLQGQRLLRRERCLISSHLFGQYFPPTFSGTPAGGSVRCWRRGRAAVLPMKRLLGCGGRAIVVADLGTPAAMCCGCCACACHPYRQLAPLHGSPLMPRACCYGPPLPHLPFAAAAPPFYAAGRQGVGLRLGHQVRPQLGWKWW